MIKWTIKNNEIEYAVFIFDKKLWLQLQSFHAKEDRMKNKIKKNHLIFDPRKTQLKKVNSTSKDPYEIDLFLEKFFTKPEYTIKSEGLHWGEVLDGPRPGILY